MKAETGPDCLSQTDTDCLVSLSLTVCDRLSVGTDRQSDRPLGHIAASSQLSLKTETQRTSLWLETGPRVSTCVTLLLGTDATSDSQQLHNDNYFIEKLIPRPGLDVKNFLSILTLTD